MIKNYFKIACRNILKYRLSSTINILGLTIGVSSCLILFLFINYESSFDKDHSQSEFTYRLVQHQKFPEETFHFNTTPYPLAEALRNDLPELKAVTQIVGLTTRTIGVKNNQNSQSLFEESNVLFADSYYPQVFDNIKWLAGNKDTALSKNNSVVLTEELAKKYFNLEGLDYQSIIGKVILLNNEEPLLVKGVVEKPSGNSNYQFEMLISYATFKKNSRYANNWSANHQGTTFVVLDDNSKKENVESAIALWKKKYLEPIENQRITYKLQPLNEIHTNTLYGSGPGSYIMPANIINIAFIVALFILLIAIVNFINLITAQSLLRSKEVGILKVLGSNRISLVFRFIIENSLLIIISLCISLTIVYFSLDKLNNALSIVNLDLKLDWSHSYLIIGIGLTTVLLATIYPAIVLSSFNPTKALKNRNVTQNPKGLTLRKTLITFQFVIVQIFVVAVVVIAAQMNFFTNKDVGFSSNAVVITPAPEFNKIEVFKNALLSNNNIEEVSFGSGPPMGINGLSLGTSFRLPNDLNEDGKYSEMKVGDVNYLNFYGLELLAGQNFTTTHDKFDQFIVNETLLKSFNWTPEEAIGKTLSINEGEATIVGVVKDYHNNALQYEITPCIILNWNIFQNNAFIKIKEGTESTISTIESAWKDSFKSSVYDYSFLDDAIEKEYIVEKLVFNGFSALSILAISIGCLGLLGLMIFILINKSKEIAIRKVLGSSATQIVSFLSKEFIVLIVIAFFIACPFAYYIMDLWLQDFTYQIELSAWMFLFGGLLTLVIALGTCSFQSIRMALVKPINSLRTE